MGALYLQPEVWGSASIAVILAQINGQPFPKAVGITGEQVTAATPFLKCK